MEKGKNSDINSQKRGSVITIFILICIVLIAFIGIGYQFIVTASKMANVTLKPINVTIPSETGQHKVSITISLIGKSNNLNKLDLEKVQLVAKESVKNLDYEEMKKENGNEYIKSTILQDLKNEFGDNIEKVTLNDLLIDVSTGGEEETHNPSVDDLLENFGWSKNK